MSGFFLFPLSLETPYGPQKGPQETREHVARHSMTPSKGGNHAPGASMPTLPSRKNSEKIAQGVLGFGALISIRGCGVKVGFPRAPINLIQSIRDESCKHAGRPASRVGWFRRGAPRTRRAPPGRLWIPFPGLRNAGSSPPPITWSHPHRAQKPRARCPVRRDAHHVGPLVHVTIQQLR